MVADGIVPPTIVDGIKRQFSDISTDVSFTENELPFLAELLSLLDLKSAVAKLELNDKTAAKDIEANQSEFGNLKFWFTRRDGSIFQDQHLSYGQKRRNEPAGDGEKMVWRNMTDDEAAMFYSAYQVGIEHVGEILRTRGLW